MTVELTRRRFLLATGMAVSGAMPLAACAPAASTAPAVSFIRATDREVREVEQSRARSGSTVRYPLAAGSGSADLGAGNAVRTWGYSAGAAMAAVGPVIRASRGDRLVVDLDNALPEDTSIHWHGLRIRNDMDGSPPDTQEPVAPGGRFRYDFTVPDPGTYWYHSHSGLQADRALVGALIVDDPDDATGADSDLVVVIDDWTDGVAATPEQILAALTPLGGGGHNHGGVAAAQPPADVSGAASAMLAQGTGHSDVLGGPTQHIAYPLHLINGRSVDAPDRLDVVAGSRVRLRVINAAAETPYRIALAGHRLTVIATDGYATRPHEGDSILIAPAQRVDVLVDVGSGIWQFVARVEGRDGAAMALIATHDAVGAAPAGSAATRISELDGQPVTDADLHPADASLLPARQPDQHWHLDLLEADDRYQWGIGGADAGKLHPRLGERVRISLTNRTSMWHPMHLHGHTFASVTHNGVRRDTTIVLPGQTVDIDFDADNPGHWMLHCHNAYHFAAGMTVPVRYIR